MSRWRSSENSEFARGEFPWIRAFAGNFEEINDFMINNSALILFPSICLSSPLPRAKAMLFDRWVFGAFDENKYLTKLIGSWEQVENDLLSDSWTHKPKLLWSVSLTASAIAEEGAKERRNVAVDAARRKYHESHFSFMFAYLFSVFMEP